MKRRLFAALLGLGALAWAPVAASADPAGPASYAAASMTFTLALPHGVTPLLVELSNPPRLEIDYDTRETIEPHVETFATGLVSRFELAPSTRGARVTLTLRQQLRGQFRVGFVGDRMQVVLTPLGGYPPRVAVAPRKPTPVPSWQPPDAVSITPVPPQRTTLPAWASPAPVVVNPRAWATPPGKAWLVPSGPPVTPRPHLEPSAEPVPTPMPTRPVPDTEHLPTPLPSVEPTYVPTPPPTAVPTPFITPEPLPSVAVRPEIPPDAVFGSRLVVGGGLPLALTASYPAGHLSSEVDYPPSGDYAWNVLFTPNFGSAIRARAVGYTLQDQEAADHGIAIQHQRGDYEATLGIFGRLPLPFGFELMGEPALRVRKVTGGDSAGALNGSLTSLAADHTYLSTGWLGLGGALSGGLGWRIYGPLAIAATGEVGYLSGAMDAKGVPSIFPLLGYRVDAELRLDFGPVGVYAGYELGHDGNSNDNSNLELTEDWTGPIFGAAWRF